MWAMPNTALRPIPAVRGSDDSRSAFPYAVPLRRLSAADLGADRFQRAFDACCVAATRFGGPHWKAEAVHAAPGRTGYVFHFARPLPSLRFAAYAAAVLAVGRPVALPADDAAP